MNNLEVQTSTDPSLLEEAYKLWKMSLDKKY
jgi:hypothetical protein